MTRALRWLVLGVLALALAMPAPAAAQERDPVRLAREAFEAGRRLLAQGNIDGAIEQWKQGYEYKDDPQFLYQIGVAYQLKPDPQKASFYFKNFLSEAPSAANRADAQRRLAEVQRQIDGGGVGVEPPPASRPEPPPPPIKVTPPPPPPPSEQGNPGRGLKIAGIAAGGAGLALTVVGVIFASQASSIQSELEASTAAGTPWSAELSDKEADGASKATLAKVTIGVGAVGVISGITLYYLGATKRAPRAEVDEEQAGLRIVPDISATHAGLTATISF